MIDQCEIWFQIKEEVKRLLELKALLGDDGAKPKQFVLKTPKVKPVSCLLK